VRADPERVQTLYNTTTEKIISPMRYNIITKSVKYIKPIDHTYRCLLHNETCSMLVVPKGLKQGELGVPARHLIVQQ
jgi:hypothetical protein